MQAFHGKQEVKDKYVARVKRHRQLDEIRKGQYWEEDEDGVFRGCAVGCTLHSGDHAAYETELGIPVELAHLEDTIFEHLSQDLALDWPARFLEAIPVGADLSLVASRFTIWLLLDEKHGVIRFAETEQQKKVIRDVAHLHERVVAGEVVTEEEWKAVWVIVWVTADAASETSIWATKAARATSAACSKDSGAASDAAIWAAAWAAASDAARVAAWAAASDAARAAARTPASAAAYVSYADKLIELVKESV